MLSFAAHVGSTSTGGMNIQVSPGASTTCGGGNCCCIGQIVITDNRIAAIVIGFSSIVISVFGTLLIIVYGNVIPALIVHMSFAGFYSSAPWDQP